MGVGGEVGEGRGGGSIVGASASGHFSPRVFPGPVNTTTVRPERSPTFPRHDLPPCLLQFPLQVHPPPLTGEGEARFLYGSKPRLDPSPAEGDQDGEEDK